jgi:hypothetical protein
MGSEAEKRDIGSFFKRERRVATMEIPKPPRGSDPGIYLSL